MPCSSHKAEGLRGEMLSNVWFLHRLKGEERGHFPAVTVALLLGVCLGVPTHRYTPSPALGPARLCPVSDFSPRSLLQDRKGENSHEKEPEASPVCTLSVVQTPRQFMGEPPGCGGRGSLLGTHDGIKSRLSLCLCPAICAGSPAQGL